MTTQFNFSEGSGVTSNGSITNDPYASQVAFYLSGDNLVDNGVNQIEVGNANVTTSELQVKAGTSSLYFDGTAKLSTPPESILTPGNRDWTVDLWVWPEDKKGDPIYGAQRIVTIDSESFNIILQKDEDTQLWSVQDIGGGNWNNPGSFEVVNEDWSHIAFQRKGNQGSAWVNGSCVLTWDMSEAFEATSPVSISVGSSTLSGVQYFGYVDQFRYTVGTARF